MPISTPGLALLEAISSAICTPCSISRIAPVWISASCAPGWRTRVTGATGVGGCSRSEW
jgi:hypothetical protein